MVERVYPTQRRNGAIKLAKFLEEASKVQVFIDKELSQPQADPLELARFLVAQSRCADGITDLTSGELNGHEFLNSYIPGCYMAKLEKLPT